MARIEYRELHPQAEAEEVYRRWLTHLDDEFARHHEPRLRAELVRDTLHQIYLGHLHGGKLNTTLVSELLRRQRHMFARIRRCKKQTALPWRPPPKRSRYRHTTNT